MEFMPYGLTILIGCIVFVVILVCVIFKCRKRCRDRNKDSGFGPAPATRHRNYLTTVSVSSEDEPTFNGPRYQSAVNRTLDTVPSLPRLAAGEHYQGLREEGGTIRGAQASTYASTSTTTQSSATSTYRVQSPLWRPIQAAPVYHIDVSSREVIHPKPSSRPTTHEKPSQPNRGTLAASKSLLFSPT